MSKLDIRRSITGIRQNKDFKYAGNKIFVPLRDAVTFVYTIFPWQLDTRK